MRAELAERVLAAVMDWDEAELRGRVQELQALASHKYDEYRGYQPGVQFLESLASWLFQLVHPAERETAVNFVLKRLIFISDAEMEHLIAVAYPDVIRRIVAARAAEDCGIQEHRIRQITSSKEFVALQRRTLFLGLSDGARLDRLRRASRELSHEQFRLVASLEGVESGMQRKLGEALGQLGSNEPESFRHVFLVDDFAGSGYTLIRREEGGFGGKLPKLNRELQQLRRRGVVSDDVRVSVLLYVASEQALTHVRDSMHEAGLDWEVRVIQEIAGSYRVDATDPDMRQLCEQYYDPVLYDEHKGHATLGFRQAALPLVLCHNTPNDSVCLLWADTTDRPNSRRVRALFPRYERHHPDRP